MNNIKTYSINGAVKYCFLVAGLVLIISCDKGFESMNKNPNVYTNPVLGNLLTTSQVRTAGVGTNDRNRVGIKYFAATNQYMAALGTNWSGDKNFENGQFGDLFETIYSVHLKELVQMIQLTKDNPEFINYYAIGSIWRVYILHRATDMYGDVPYKEAGLGFANGTFKPKYDKQSEIYPLMLTELQTAIGQLNAAKPTLGASDIIYSGDLNKWKTFAYSLMLRLGMRMSNVDPVKSKEWVVKAITGGVMKSNADMAIVRHAPGSTNSENRDAAELKRESFPESNQGKGPVKLAKTLIDYLVRYNDPRLPFYATMWEGNILSMQAAKLATTTNPALQKGLPNGYDATTIKSVIPTWSNNMLAEYSEPNTGTIASLSAPSVILSYAEVEFLLAEASLRGWDASPATAHYNAAVNASMKSTSIFPQAVLFPGGGAFAISQAAIDSYLLAHPLNGASFALQMEQLHTQFYLAHFMWYDNFEAFSNIRRTGYPVLTPPNYPGNFTGGKALVRLRYPVSEATLNKENYDAAVATQGEDQYTTPVWWDK
ncbi:MAG: SusD/RagB family nutrient-binding outer membrane lipoprotein [Chitinophagaceae bacterium]